MRPTPRLGTAPDSAGAPTDDRFLLNLALHRAPAPLLVVDGGGVVRACSDAAATILGRRRDEIEGRQWRDLQSECAASDLRPLEEHLFTDEDEPAGRLVALAGCGNEIVELRQMNRRKDEFLAVLAHELRNPLAPLRNGIHLARVVGTADSSFKSLIGMMERQVGVLVRLVDDLLDVSRIGSGKLQLASSRLSLREVVHESCELMRDRFGASGHRLHVVLCDDACTAHGDRGRLEQVFVNLLSNAAKYSDPGSNVRVDLERIGEAAVITVSDEGVGLSPRDAEDIFDMYSQVRLHKARAQGGLGIGLALVRRLVELHGGTVGATSDGPGKGTRFRVRLPLGRPRPAD